MKTILLYDPRFPAQKPTRLIVDDVVASAAVRAGIAAPADPADAPLLLAGGPLDGGNLRPALLQVAPTAAIARVMLPQSVLLIAAGRGLAAVEAAPLPTAQRLPLGARLVFAGDSKFAINSSPGMRNIQYQTVDRLNGRVRMAVAGDQGIGGNKIQDLKDRVGNTTAQKADITIIGIGHNSLGDGAASVITQLAALHADLRAGLGDRLILWTTVLPSQNSAGGADLYPIDHPVLCEVNDWIMARQGTDSGHTLALSFGYRSTDGLRFDPLTMCYLENVSRYVHPNARGAEFTSSLLANLLDTLVDPQTLADALSSTAASGAYGPNIDQLHLYDSGIAGTKTGATGSVVTGAAVINGTTATVTCSVDQVGGYYRQVIEGTGMAATEGTIVLNRPNASAGRVPINAVVGDHFEILTGYDLSHTDGVSAPIGVLQYGQQLSLSRPRYSMGVYGTGDVLLGGPLTERKGPRVARTQAGLVRTATGNLALSAHEFGIRVAAGAVNFRLVLWWPIVRRTEQQVYSLPVYLGGDGIQGTSERIGNSANATNLTIGTTYNFQPGLWSGGAIAVTNRLQISTDGGATWADVSGTTNGGWSWVAAGAAGNRIRQTVTATNATGTVTATADFTLV